MRLSSAGRAARGLALLSFIAAAWPDDAVATHLDGMTLDARVRDPSQPLTVTVTGLVQRKWSFDAPRIGGVVQAGVPGMIITLGAGGDYLQFLGEVFVWGDPLIRPITVRVIEIDNVNDRYVGQIIPLEYTYAAPGTHQIRFRAADRASTLLDGNHDTEMQVTAELGVGGAGPSVATYTGPLYLPVYTGLMNTLSLPVTAPPGTTVRFEVTPSVESLLSFPVPIAPSQFSLAADGTIRFLPFTNGLRAISVKAIATDALGRSSSTNIDLLLRSYAPVVDPGTWRTSPWSACPATCEDSYRTRGVECTRNGSIVAETSCDPATRPLAYELCEDAAPTISCPSPATYECTGPGGAVATLSATAAAVCDPAVAADCPDSGSTFALGQTEATCSAVDDAGHVASCSTTVTVVDTTAPAITCAAPATLECTGARGAVFDPEDATATDLCGTASVNRYDALTFPVGTSTLAYDAVDDTGNSVRCNSTVTVADTTPPAIACPAPIVAECTGDLSVFLDPGHAIVSDACGAVTVDEPGLIAAHFGTTLVPYTAVDEEGLTATCSTQIDVVDTTPPMIACPPPVVAECEGNRQAVLDPGDAWVFDACFTADVNDPGPGAFPVGETAVTFTATDGVGLQSSCSTAITVRDTTAPTIACPAPIVAECTSAGGAAVTPGAASAADGCSGVAVSSAPAATFPVGTTSVGYTATDEAGLTASCAATITVADTIAPAFAPGALAPQTLTAGCSVGAGTTGFVTPAATDACGAVTVTCDDTSALAPGSHQVSCTATDGAGHQTTGTIAVTVGAGLRVAFDAPLADDNVADDVTHDADVTNVFHSGGVIQHRVRVFDCSGQDVTSSAPLIVRLRVSPGANGSGTNLINDASDYVGAGDPTGLMSLVGGRYQFGLKTNAAEYPRGGHVFQSLVTVAYAAMPQVTVAVEDARLESK